MNVAAAAANSFLSWLETTEHPVAWEVLGEALSSWLSFGGVVLVHEDYATFLQMVVILIGDPKQGLPSGRYRYRVAGMDQPQELTLVGQGALLDEWAAWFEEDEFRAAVYRYRHPDWDRHVPVPREP